MVGEEFQGFGLPAKGRGIHETETEPKCLPLATALPELKFTP